MLPAISSDLPAYLLPPKVGDEGRQTTPDDFGPAARVDISADRAIAAQSAQPGTGLYGPDGQFVDAAARRALQSRPPQDGSGNESDSDQPSSDRAGDTAPSQPQTADIQADIQPVVSSQSQSAQPDRGIALDNYDAIVPPAAREELRALADRVGRRSSEEALSPDEYKKLAELMSRVGRHSDAMWARGRAEKLEQADQPVAQPETTPVLAASSIMN